ncbi:hypothetical protein E2C01_008158 [Portunus trituberculatus]|uniref:Uncharacterized protein n=1 Tax=Portunus trituberculatus TaxID=210409 RepID=A0A5B7D1K9_PORTR|nr:hypothetical protein [Portunus trituberculatus]
MNPSHSSFDGGFQATAMRRQNEASRRTHAITTLMHHKAANEHLPDSDSEYSSPHALGRNVQSAPMRTNAVASLLHNKKSRIVSQAQSFNSEETQIFPQRYKTYGKVNPERRKPQPPNEHLEYPRLPEQQHLNDHQVLDALWKQDSEHTEQFIDSKLKNRVPQRVRKSGKDKVQYREELMDEEQDQSVPYRIMKLWKDNDQYKGENINLGQEVSEIERNRVHERMLRLTQHRELSRAESLFVGHGQPERSSARRENIWKFEREMKGQDFVKARVQFEESGHAMRNDLRTLPLKKATDVGTPTPSRASLSSPQVQVPFI